MSKPTVAVLRGGPSNQYDMSLQTGMAVLKGMPEKYRTEDILISRDGGWYRGGVAKSPERALIGVDVVWNALHGDFGEDGKVQRILDSLSVPYTGSNSLASALGMNKIMFRDLLKTEGIQTPYFVAISSTEDVTKKLALIYQKFFLPIIVKPAMSGGSLGVTLVKDFADLGSALETAFQFSPVALIEEYLHGKETSVAVIDHFRSEPTYTLVPVEIKYPAGDEIYTYQAKLGGLAEYQAPGIFSALEKNDLRQMAARIHSLLGLRGYSQTDFIITPRRGIYVLETNTLPSLAENSIMAKSLESVGSSIPEFLEHEIGRALAKS